MNSQDRLPGNKIPDYLEPAELHLQHVPRLLDNDRYLEEGRHIHIGSGPVWQSRSSMQHFPSHPDSLYLQENPVNLLWVKWGPPWILQAYNRQSLHHICPTSRINLPGMQTNPWIEVINQSPFAPYPRLFPGCPVFH